MYYSKIQNLSIPIRFCTITVNANSFRILLLFLKKVGTLLLQKEFFI